MKRKLGLQSWCLRHFKTTEGVIAKLKETGLSTIELCGVHANFYGTEQDREALIRAYQTAGVAIHAIGVEKFRNDEARTRTLFQFAARAGCKTILADFPLQDLAPTLALAERLAEEFNINVGIHNHGGWHWLGSKQALTYVFSLSGKRIGLALDTAWALHAHENPLELAKTFADRLHGLHIKDFTFDRAGKESDVVVGTGNLDLPGLFGLLDASAFKGSLTLEYEADVESPVPALRKCVTALAPYVE